MVVCSVSRQLRLKTRELNAKLHSSFVMKRIRKKSFEMQPTIYHVSNNAGEIYHVSNNAGEIYHVPNNAGEMIPP